MPQATLVIIVAMEMGPATKVLTPLVTDLAMDLSHVSGEVIPLVVIHVSERWPVLLLAVTLAMDPASTIEPALVSMELL